MPNARSIQTERKFEERNNLTDLRGAGKISWIQGRCRQSPLIGLFY
jgi:hypothetical protein